MAVQRGYQVGAWTPGPRTGVSRFYTTCARTGRSRLPERIPSCRSIMFKRTAALPGPRHLHPIGRQPGARQRDRRRSKSQVSQLCCERRAGAHLVGGSVQPLRCRRGGEAGRPDPFGIRSRCRSHGTRHGSVCCASGSKRILSATPIMIKPVTNPPPTHFRLIRGNASGNAGERTASVRPRMANKKPSSVIPCQIRKFWSLF
jgi:hypothetical protein